MAAVDPALVGVLRGLCVGELAWPLYLYGQPGRGKTAAALAVLDSVATARRVPEQVPAAFRDGDSWWLKNTVEYQTATELAEQTLTVYRNGPGYWWGQIEGGGCQLAVLDELGTRKNVTDSHYQAVQRFIDAREGRPLILISNLSLQSLSDVYDARIASRAGAGTVFELRGNDRRIE